jgi:hypothetical protein
MFPPRHVGHLPGRRHWIALQQRSIRYGPPSGRRPVGGLSVAGSFADALDAIELANPLRGMPFGASFRTPPAPALALNLKVSALRKLARRDRAWRTCWRCSPWIGDSLASRSCSPYLGAVVESVSRPLI